MSNNLRYDATSCEVYARPTSYVFLYADNTQYSWNNVKTLFPAFTIRGTADIELNGSFSFYSNSTGIQYIDVSLQKWYLAGDFAIYHRSLYINQTGTHISMPIHAVFYDVPAGTYNIYGMTPASTDSNDFVTINLGIFYK